MKIVLENSSIVVLAKDVNLSILKPIWLLRNGIFSEEELQGNIVITPVNVHIATQDFQFTVLPDRLQLRLLREYPGARSDITRIIDGLVKVLPHTPYVAAGLNFDYLFGPDTQESFVQWNRELFGSPFCVKVPWVENAGPLFGAYVSFNVFGMRLKVDIKPAKASATGGPVGSVWQVGQDLMRVNLNFHADVVDTEDRGAAVLGATEKWEKASECARELVAMIHD